MGHVAAVARAALDLLFPPVCLSCGECGAAARPALCDSCWDSIVRLGPPWCAICGRPFKVFPSPEGDACPGRAELCGRCSRRRPAFAYSRSAALYQGAVREALHAFKFSGKTALAGPLTDLLLEVCGPAIAPAPDLVVPVPLHRRREQERGYNQSALLARRVARRLGAAHAPRALWRVRPTSPQAELTGAERRTNVRGAFAVRSPGALAGRHVLLIDDVLTTGTTVAECARVLAAAGAGAVGVLTVARVA